MASAQDVEMRKAAVRSILAENQGPRKRARSLRGRGRLLTGKRATSLPVVAQAPDRSFTLPGAASGTAVRATTKASGPVEAAPSRERTVTKGGTRKR
jgi:hypothetical protein